MKQISTPFSYVLSALIAILLFSCSNGDIQFDSSGSFEVAEVIVSSQANGSIVELNADEGNLLQKGEIIGIIDTTQLYLQKLSLLSNAEGVRVQYPDIFKQTSSIREQLKSLEREKRRIERLISENAANRKQLDDIDAQINVLNGQLSALTSSLQKNSAHISAQSSAVDIQIAQIDDLLKKCRISIPTDGTLIEKYAEVGEFVTIGTQLFKIANLNDMYLRAYVTNDQLARIKLNSPVTVRVDDGSGAMKSHPGRISWISDKAEFTPKTIKTRNERANLVYAIKVAVKNDGLLKIGMYGEVVFNPNDSDFSRND